MQQLCLGFACTTRCRYTRETSEVLKRKFSNFEPNEFLQLIPDGPEMSTKSPRQDTKLLPKYRTSITSIYSIGLNESTTTVESQLGRGADLTA